MITLSVRSVLDGFPEKREAIVAAVAEKLSALDILLQSKIQSEALSGGILKSHTSGLKNSVRALPVDTAGTQLLGVVEAGGTGRGGAPWARLLEEGSDKQGRYQIVAKNGKALAFVVGSKLVITKSVQHPYMRAFHFMSLTQDEMAPEIVADLQLAAAEASAA